MKRFEESQWGWLLRTWSGRARFYTTGKTRDNSETGGFSSTTSCQISLTTSCRSDSDDELENAEFIGLNTYVHCDGSRGPDDRLIGYETLLDDFITYDVHVPVIVSACLPLLSSLILPGLSFLFY